MIDTETVEVKVSDLREGDKVDLESCPYLHHYPIAEFEYVEVVEVTQETPTCIVVGYDGVGCAAYDPNQVLRILSQGNQ